ncbi:hypothetical protein [Methylocella sp.]|uniref:hypothetical protein n=1 Tax=Methylocella sp. TaxID=1978226 RepID=UPI0037842FF6
MPNVTVPAADPGLPEDTAVLAETDRGLAVVRPAGLKALRPTFLSEEELGCLLALLDELASAEHLWLTRLGADGDRGRRAAKLARRAMIQLLKKVRRARSKTLDDLLFKALVLEGVDSSECHQSRTLGHSIVNDLLSADCMWRAA